MRIAHLIKVDADTNNNRVYIMSELNDGSFQVEYGRQGAKYMKRRYPMEFWDTQRSAKLAEGYVDRTADYQISAIATKDGEEYKPIPDEEVRNMVEYLMSCSRHIVRENYTVSHDKVSETMIEAAQDTIYHISISSNLDEMRGLYKKLFIIIPRKMKDVAAALPTSLEEGQKKVMEEQNLLDALKTVKAGEIQKKQSAKTVLDSVGLNIRPVSDKEAEKIREKMGEVQHLYKRAFRVENIRTESNFRKYMEDHGLRDSNIHFYYHGSGNANYWGIATQGLSLNPKAPITGKMFGYGLYFAPLARKSIGYTSIQGSYWHHGKSNRAYLAVFKVVYKNASHTETCNGYSHLHSAPKGHDAVFAHAGSQLRNDEVIVYNEAQCTIQYLIELNGTM